MCVCVCVCTCMCVIQNICTTGESERGREGGRRERGGGRREERERETT